MHKFLVFALALILVGIPAFDWLSAAQQDPAQDPVTIDPTRLQNIYVLPPPPQDPHWDTLIVDSDTPMRLIEVPRGKRFVLTDLIMMSHDEFRQQMPSGEDRLWMERVNDRGRKVILDALMRELPHHYSPENVFMPEPLRWETGIVIGPGNELWLNYRFAGKKSDHVRRVHFTGYFEDADSQSNY